MGPLVVFGMYVSRQKALEKYGDKKKSSRNPYVLKEQLKRFSLDSHCRKQYRKQR